MSNEKNSSCDRDFAVVNQKARMKTPNGWLHEFRATRKNPSSFNIIKMESEMFQNVTEHINVLYKTSCPIPTRPIREVVFEEAHPRLLRLLGKLEWSIFHSCNIEASWDKNQG